MSPLTIIADIKAKADRAELVREALEKLIAPTRQEAGCVVYDLHQDNTDPSHFLFFEIWESRALWQDHMKSAHILAHGKATAGAIESVTVSEMTQIG